MDNDTYDVETKNQIILEFGEHRKTVDSLSHKNKYNKIITLREREVLLLLSNGDSAKIVADKLNISLTTAISHRKNLIQKFQVKNTTHLIKIAVLANIIS